jgi:hypothetical protein
MNSHIVIIHAIEKSALLYIPVRDRPVTRVEDWYRPKITSWLYRYTFVPNLCIYIAPCTGVYFTFLPYFTKFVHIYSGLHRRIFYIFTIFSHGQSESILQDCRAQDICSSQSRSRWHQYLGGVNHCQVVRIFTSFRQRFFPVQSCYPGKNHYVKLVNKMWTWLSFGEIPWFDETGEIRHCDWSKIAYICMCPVWVYSLWVLFSQSQRRISPFSSNHGISPDQR